MQNAAFLFAAFTIIWAVVFGYVLVLVNRQRRLSREISDLKELVGAKYTDKPHS